MIPPEKFNPQKDLPTKCQKCLKSIRFVAPKNCQLCLELKFQELILCDLNRRVQGQAEFKCYAFKPRLEMVDSSGKMKNDVSPSPVAPSQKIPLLEIFNSDKFKYRRALALQKLERDPEGIFLEIKYHFVWNAIHRKPIFKRFSYPSDSIHDIFAECGELIGGFVNLLWLAQDHVHIYADSNGDYSVDTMINEIKRSSGISILSNFPEVKNRLGLEVGIWDEAYFVETIS